MVTFTMYDEMYLNLDKITTVAPNKTEVLKESIRMIPVYRDAFKDSFKDFIKYDLDPEDLITAIAEGDDNKVLGIVEDLIQLVEEIIMTSWGRVPITSGEQHFKLQMEEKNNELVEYQKKRKFED